MTDADIARLYQSGESTLSIARRFGLHSTTVGRRLRRAGGKARSLAKAAQVREAKGRGKCRIRKTS